MAVSCWITSSPLQKFPPLSTSSFQLQTSYHHLRLHSCSSSINFLAEPLHCSNRVFRKRFLRHSRDLRVRCNSETPSNLSGSSDSTSIQVYRDFERLVTETVKQSQDAWGGASNWSEVEGAWVLGPTHSKPWSIVHFIGGIFVGAAPQLAYRSFLERLCEKGILVIATPYASGFDHFSIADEVQFKFDRCLRSLQETVGDLPTFGIGHSLGSVVHLLIGSRYAVQRNGNVFMAFNNKAETTLKQLENLSPPIMKQVLPLLEQLPPLYMDLAKGRENFSPKPEETRRLVKTYYGINRNLLIKFKDDMIDETSMLAQVLTVDSAISCELDMSIRTVTGDHGTPLQQAFPDVPPAMADAVNRGSELLSNLIAGTPWETMAKDVSTSLGIDTQIFRAESSKDLENLVDVLSSWMSSNTGPNLLR
ncbi:uncharacterized protein [Spinacia oleracea]|uniref:Uncharacterized protein isoform X2 n=1 Tax=Spinacia oleracea TaxID=3562 RepID=A0ABM3RTH3_SPIOL|nr:uncharacterized protein LOC110789761 isoform X2 [Spinacia oleracea]